MNNNLRRVAEIILPPIVCFAVFVLLWNQAVTFFDWKAFQVPRPRAVLAIALSEWKPLLQGMLLTAQAAAAGFTISLIVGSLVAFLFSQSRFFQRGLYPYAIFFQTVPIVAIAPLIITWFGTGFFSVVITAAIVSLFPIITNMTTGLTELDRNAVELFEINNATRLQLLLKLRLPSAIPFLITGAKTSSGLAVIGAIIGEFFAGYGREGFGLGYLIYKTNSQLRIDYTFAATIASTVLGLTIFVTVSVIGDAVLLRWRRN